MPYYFFLAVSGRLFRVMLAGMFIRTTTTRNNAGGETYITHRLVESRRVGGKVRQVTLLNLGRHFPLPKARWLDLCARIEHLLNGQQTLVPMDVPPSVERHAQQVFSRLLAQGRGAPLAMSEAEENSAPARTPRSLPKSIPTVWNSPSRAQSASSTLRWPSCANWPSSRCSNRWASTA